MDGSIGLFGKHPTFGDFISEAMMAEVQTGLQGWIDSVLSSLRDRLADDWSASWDSAPTLRFWIGRGLSGHTLAGVMHPSRDAVGRRYPLFVVAQNAAVSAPVIDTDQTYYDGVQHALDTSDDIKALPSRLSDAVMLEDAQARGEGPLLWAHNADGDLDALLSAAKTEDQHRAVTVRSYWWVQPTQKDEPAIWLGTAGFPDAHAMGWLLFGRNIATVTADV